jgi:hypothetical protein
MNNMNMVSKIFWIAIFAVAMAFVESAVVVYLRAIFYPDGFQLPLRTITDYKIIVEIFREVATIFMLMSVAFLAGKGRWERFAWFLLSFGVWDIFYYVWLKVLVDWPSSLFTWDILFLIPLPWIGPVIAPLSVSFMIIIFSVLITRLIHNGHDFKPAASSYIFAISAIAVLLYSFMHDTGATLHQQIPKPYRYGLLITGDILFITAFLISYARNSART